MAALCAAVVAVAWASTSTWSGPPAVASAYASHLDSAPGLELAQRATRTATPRITLPTATLATGTARAILTAVAGATPGTAAPGATSASGAASGGTSASGAASGVGVPGDVSPVPGSGGGDSSADSGGPPTGSDSGAADGGSAAAQDMGAGTGTGAGVSDGSSATVSGAGSSAGSVGDIVADGGDRAVARLGPGGPAGARVDDPHVIAMWERYGSPHEGQSMAERLTAGRPGLLGLWPVYLVLAVLFVGALGAAVSALRRLDDHG